MNRIQRVFHSNFFIKLKSWEYWPFGIVQAPLFIYWLWLSLKARSLVFFSASNPGILMGGMFGESKFEVLEKVPSSHRPRTLRGHESNSVKEISDQIRTAGLQYPLIFKPDLGERGRLVKKIRSEEDIAAYLQLIKGDFLIQEFVDLPLEFGVFYVRYPDEPAGRVTSIVGKEMLSVTGDGHKPLHQLIFEKERAKLQWEALSRVFHDQWDRVLKEGEKLELVSIGNHCLGTKFLNANDLITPQLSESFDRISKQIEGFYFGRFDLRVDSLENLQKGNVMIMELNGCGAEPAHIYQPGYPLTGAFKVLFRHWSDIYRISKENHRLGVPYISFAEARRIYKHFRILAAY